MPEQIIISPEVRDIISARPAWIVRNGISIFFAILLLVAASTYFIKYPDVVTASARLTSANAPKEIKFKTQSRLVALNTKEGDLVNAKDVLGALESNANATIVMVLEENLLNLKRQIDAGNSNGIANQQNNVATESLGELQTAYQSFLQAKQMYKQYVSGGYFLRRKAMLSEDFKYLRNLKEYLLQQKSLQQKDLVLTQKNYEASQSLKKDLVIAALEMRTEESKYLGKQLSIPQVNTAITSNESSQHEKEKEIATLVNEINQQKDIFYGALNNMLAAIEDWKTKYLLIAPIAGKVVFSKPTQKDKIYNANESFCFINPGDTKYIAEINIPQSNFGKVSDGQQVTLKFPSYPFQEFGAIKGQLLSVSSIPSDSGFVATVSLPKGLVTNYNKTLQFKEGLVASAEIVTKDLTLFERLVNSLMSAVKN